MTIKNISLFSLLLITNFISARKQIAPNLIKKLVNEIMHNSQQKKYGRIPNNGELCEVTQQISAEKVIIKFL